MTKNQYKRACKKTKVGKPNGKGHATPKQVKSDWQHAKKGA